MSNEQDTQNLNPAILNGPSLNGQSAGSVAVPAPQIEWSVSETLSGRTLLLSGVTGFLGKAFLSMLLRYHPDIAQVYVLIRARKTMSAEQRFFQTVANNTVMDPLREIYADGYIDFIKEKCTVLAGDITEEHLGLGEEEARALSSKLDVFVNSAGLTNFNPNLESALRINTLSQFKMLDFLRLGGGHASFLHVSTCFVAGNQSGKIPEIMPGPTVYPNYKELGVLYDHRREIEDCRAMIQHAKLMADDQEHQVEFAQEARKDLRKQNIDPNNAIQLEKAVDKIRSKWLTTRLSTEGRQRAEFWGWPNIYTYTKSMGERILADNRDEINLAIFRPAIIESALEYPSVGWNEGINTSAPLAFLMSKGHRYVPTQRGINLDVVPVDFCAGAMIGAAAALLNKRQSDVYHCGSGHLNPVSVERIIELTNLGLRKLNSTKNMPAWKKLALNSMDSVPVGTSQFNRSSAPGIKRAVGGLRGLLKKIPTEHLGGLGKTLKSVDKGLKTAETMTGLTEMVFEMMIPFTHDNAFHFQTESIPKMVEGLPASEAHRYGSPVADLDWRHYWMDIHMPGLAKYAFPELEDKFQARTKKQYTYDDLLEMFDSSTENFAGRTALQHHVGGGITQRYTYAELKRHAERAAAYLNDCGVGQSAPVLIVSENRPQWGMSYFGILKAGGVAVPVDAESTALQLANLVKSCGAPALILSESVRERVGDELVELLAEDNFSTRFIGFDELFGAPLLRLAADGGSAIAPPASHTEIARAAADGQPLASLIYTSGTTGTPKGVMLTHQNFTNLLAGLNSTFSINERDGFLSVLPLHHTFEFACGFLMPLSRGAAVTYIDELTSDEINSALEATPITALIGVPALWQLLHRRVRQRLDDAPDAVTWALNFLLDVNTTLRDRFNLNIGPTAFGAVHKAFGGRLRYLISGGAALPSDVLEAFHGMGFNLYEGYGLTEAAPVLTVNGPREGLNPGSVGKPIQGIEVKILNENEAGVGEVVARAKSVMRGYLGREEDTEKALQDGWLHTGDLGKLDARGRLTIVGRAKEVIVTAGGKNVYPDELEELYAGCEDIEEFSVVGLPDGKGSERVACLVRPRIPTDADADGNEVELQIDASELSAIQARIREHFRVEGARVPAAHRISALRFSDEELPRTATRKIKRRAVVELLESMQSAAHALPETSAESGDAARWSWLYQKIAQLADVDAEDIYAGTHFADELAFDSLMVAELASILGERDFVVTLENLAGVETVLDLQNLLDNNGHANADADVSDSERASTIEELPVPAAISNFGKRLLRMSQKRAYDDFFDVDVFGRANIPHHNPNLIVVANHSSHLDMGLIKYALGDFGRDIRALAAEDYFFDNALRKTYFNNFTNLIPVARSGSLEGSLVHAEAALSEGEMLLIFPEGTRSKDGKLQEFRSGMGYLAATKGVDILPIYLAGTHRALPKGNTLPSLASRKLKVYIGQPISAHAMRKQTATMSNLERYEFISKQAHGAVAQMRDAANTRRGEDGEDLRPLFNDLSAKFAPNRLTEEVSFYFSLGNADKLKWNIVVDAEKCHIGLGKPANGKADCVMKTSPAIFKKIVTESYIPSMDEFMSGKVKTNAPQLLAQFQAAFEL